MNPELLSAFDAMPTFAVSAETLDDIRVAVAQATVPAPAGPGTTVEERFVPRSDGTSVRILVCTPAGATRTGGLLWMHGGGMVMATADANEPLCRHLAHIADCVIVAVDYRLAPEHPYPAALDDCLVALRWMRGAAGELGFPANRLAVAGESGGGCLAAGLTLLSQDPERVALSAQFLLYPMLDDRTATGTEPDPLPYAGEFVWTRESNRFAWGAVLGQEPGENIVPRHASPGRVEDLAGLPPTSIFVGDLDLFVGENLRFARNLVKSGVATELHLYPGAYHGFISFAPDAAISKRGFQDFAGAITRHFREYVPGK